MHLTKPVIVLPLLVSGIISLPLGSDSSILAAPKRLPDTTSPATIRTSATKTISSNDQNAQNEQMTIAELKPLMEKLTTSEGFAAGGKAKNKLRLAKERHRLPAGVGKIMRRGAEERTNANSSNNVFNADTEFDEDGQSKVQGVKETQETDDRPAHPPPLPSKHIDSIEEHGQKQAEALKDVNKKLRWNREIEQMRLIAKEWEEWGGVDILPEALKAGSED
jgi:hypothetical protein